ncbi:MAG: GNAT family N-acetyltransferase [Solobacterium sp.]|nr:GNAT family N-acetyltransferase [Solobacterium sp.]
MIKNELQIRELMPEDAKAILAFTKRVGGETDNLTFGSNGIPISEAAEQTFLAAVHEDPKSIMLGVFRDNELIADGSIHSLPRRMSHRAEFGITVVRDEWNKGIGSILMEKLIGFAKEAGIEIINLEVRADNRNAIHLYEKYGFRHIGTSPAYFKIGGEYIDFEIMYLDLRG